MSRYSDGPICTRTDVHTIAECANYTPQPRLPQDAEHNAVVHEGEPCPDDAAPPGWTEEAWLERHVKPGVSPRGKRRN